jgi:hypothetical protein
MAEILTKKIGGETWIGCKPFTNYKDVQWIPRSMILGLCEGGYMGSVWTDITVPNNEHRVAHTLEEVEKALNEIAVKEKW